jgi:hypothetical protein
MAEGPWGTLFVCPGSIRCPAVHMVTMKITAYMNLAPEHVSPGDGDAYLRINKLGFGVQPGVYPTPELAAADALPGTGIYTVTFDIEDGTVFEVTGQLPNSGRRYGIYTAGFFWDFDAAFAAASGIGIRGTRADILVRPEITEVFDDYASWKAQFDVDAVASGPASQDRAHVRQLVAVVAGPHGIEAFAPRTEAVA